MQILDSASNFSYQGLVLSWSPRRITLRPNKKRERERKWQLCVRCRYQTKGVGLPTPHNLHPSPTVTTTTQYQGQYPTRAAQLFTQDTFKPSHFRVKKWIALIRMVRIIRGGDRMERPTSNPSPKPHPIPIPSPKPYLIPHPNPNQIFVRK